MDPDLDELIEKERAAYKEFTDAFIRHTIARENLNRRLHEIRLDIPTLFSQDKDPT